LAVAGIFFFHFFPGGPVLAVGVELFEKFAGILSVSI
jgi:hypothetical protein